MSGNHVYTHGHHESVLRSHNWRTVKNSCGYLIPYIDKDAKVLDIGCGPGTITIDLAKNYVPEGSVTAVEYVPEPLEIVKQNAKKAGVSNVVTAQADIHALPYDDETFDIVHAHQVLQHIRDPVQALREMMRVAKTGGIVAAREADFGGFVWYPESPGIDQWAELYVKVASANGGTPLMGRRIHATAMKAGYEKSKMAITSSNWCYATDKEIEWWTELWADRTVQSTFASTAQENSLATMEDLNKVANDWRAWGRNPDAWFSVLNGELIYRK